MTRILRRFSAVLLWSGLVFVFPRTSLAAIEFFLENPAQDQVLSGVSIISGWAFSTESDKPVTVRLRVDDGEAIEVPCCTERTDVVASYPDYPQARTSVFGQIFNFNLLEEGAHTLTIEIEDATGARETREHRIETVKPGGFAFLRLLDLTRARATLSEDKQAILIDRALARDKASDEFEEVSLSLAWQENLQVMGIVASHNDNEPSASAAAAQSTSPQAARVSAEDRAVEPVQVGTEGQTAEPDWVQNPAIIRIDPTSGSRTILSDVDIPD